MGEDRSANEHGPDRRRVTVAEAAEILGITAEAVRTRIKRDKLDSIKDPRTARERFTSSSTPTQHDPTLTLHRRVKTEHWTKLYWWKRSESRWRTCRAS